MKDRKGLVTPQSKTRFFYILLTSSVLLGIIAGLSAGNAAGNDSKRWTDKFNLSACTWSSTGRNDFFILEPGYQAILDGDEDNKSVRLEITVLSETKKVGGVETRVVEERESKEGELVEVSRNYFAICAPMNDVFYFGEEVDMYKDGKVTTHEGAWIAEKDGAKAGLFMPSRPLLGARYYQEIAPKIAMDRVEVESDMVSMKTPAGDFNECLKTEETTPLEPGIKEYKIYARGIGIIQDGDLLLSKYGSINSKKQ